MKANIRTLLPVAMLGVALLAASCAEQKRKEVLAIVNQYLEDEVAGDYADQHKIIDANSAKALPLPVGEGLANSFEPKRLMKYKVNDVQVEGATAQAKIATTFQMIWPGGSVGLPEQYNLTIYLIHQSDGWRVDEIKTRTRALDAVVTPGQGDTWLMLQKQKRQFQDQSAM